LLLFDVNGTLSANIFRHMPRRLPDIPAAIDAQMLVEEAYRTRLIRSGKTPHHPIAVAKLLLADGQSSRVVLTGLLHDVLEDTDVTDDELRDRFGPEISGLVQLLTQDESIPDYRTRKAALRSQILGGSPEAAIVTLADKIAKLRGRKKPPSTRKLDHYRATLDGVEERYGSSPLSAQLREVLGRWR
jgi:GTP diphosphokinase / guanosine-3',5'-bis(diphosphate) 3'-diphosphatase